MPTIPGLRVRARASEACRAVSSQATLRFARLDTARPTRSLSLGHANQVLSALPTILHIHRGRTLEHPANAQAQTHKPTLKAEFCYAKRNYRIGLCPIYPLGFF